jgi:hypothetical protein
MARRSADTRTVTSGGESVQGYFKRIFKENPKLLRGRSNAAALQIWLRDHPGHTEVPNSVKVGLSNAKSAVRSRRRKRRAGRSEDQMAVAGGTVKGPVANGRRKGSLGALEEQIDDCMIQAKMLDREGLQDVITHLRRARNAVVWKMGQ